MKTLKKGILIAVEGIDGSGKTTVTHEIAKALRQDYAVVCTREPGGTALGMAVRTIIQSNTSQYPMAQYLLFAAARAQHMEELILPALAQGNIVISDRMADSSLVYQGYGQNVDMPMITLINRWTMHQREPDIILYIAIDSVTARQRIASRGNAQSFDAAPEKFFQRLIAGYEAVYAQKKNVIRIDGNAPLAAVVHQAQTNLFCWVTAHERTLCSPG